MNQPSAMIPAEKEGNVICLFNCASCGKEIKVEVPLAGVMARHMGAKVQDAFPDLDVKLRELFASGICPACFPA